MTAASSDFIEAIEFMPAEDIRKLAKLLCAPASVQELQRRCRECPEAANAVRRHIFCPARSRTPPRRTMSCPTSPPRVARVRRAAKGTTPPRQLHF